MTIQFGKLVRSVSPYTANYCSIYSHHSLTKSVTKVLKQKPESKIVTAIDAKGKKTNKHTHILNSPKLQSCQGLPELQKVLEK